MFTDWRINVWASQAEFSLSTKSIMLSGPRLPNHNPTKRPPREGMHTFRVLDGSIEEHRALLIDSFPSIEFDDTTEEFVYIGDADLVRIKLASTR